LVAALALPVLLYSIATGWDARGRHFHALFQFQLMGICGAFLTGDAFNLFVFFEIMLIASYGLMIHSGGRDRLRAGVQYVVMNLAGSTLFLFALGTLYAVTGTLNMADLAEKAAAIPAEDAALLRVGAVLLLFVFALKAALVPLQFWLPATYAHAPGPVAALFAIMTKVGAYAILRMYTLAFGPESSVGTLAADLLLPAALVTLIIGIAGVLGARDLGKQAAFAVVASVGTLMLAFSQFGQAATGAGLYYLVQSTFAAAALFLVVDLVRERRGSVSLQPQAPMSGHGLLAALFFVAAIGMAGMPPLPGFLGKLMVLDATRDASAAALIWFVVLATSLLAVVGFARAGSHVFWKTETKPEAGAAPALEPAQMLAAMLAASVLAMLVVLTVLAGPISAWLQETAAQIHAPENYIRAVLGARAAS